MTIYEIAEQARVSPATVSRVLNDAPNVASSTRERVQTIIEDVAFVPNRAARELARLKTDHADDMRRAPTGDG